MPTTREPCPHPPVQRDPLLLDPEDLRCYGFCVDLSDDRCRSCAFRRSCTSACLHWQDSDFASLSERVQSLRTVLATPTLNQTTIEGVYAAEYRRHFGRDPRMRPNARTNAVFGRLLSLCLREDIDPATFISANMAVLKDAPHVLRWGFQPNMLSGEKAKGRYNGRLRRANRRYKRGLADVMGSERDLLRRDLFLGELAVAELFVRSRHVGDPMSWEACVEHGEPTARWLEFQHQRGETFLSMMRLGVLVQEAELATLHAACDLADSFQVGLSNRVAAPKFTWLLFAELICELFPQHRTLSAPVVGGVLVWPRRA